MGPQIDRLRTETREFIDQLAAVRHVSEVGLIVSEIPVDRTIWAEDLIGVDSNDDRLRRCQRGDENGQK